ncbi:MAG: hypothetical protein ABJA66_14600 [Actinomycetota bacterium]
MNIKTDEDKIVIRDIPIIQWLIGLFFTVVGIKVLLSGLLAAAGFNFTYILIGLFAAYMGYTRGLSGVYLKVSIDRLLRSVTVKRIGLRQKIDEMYSADEIEKIYSESETSSEDITTYTICMTLKNGQSMVLGGQLSSKAECETIIKTAQAFLEQTVFPDKYHPNYL